MPSSPTSMPSPELVTCAAAAACATTSSSPASGSSTPARWATPGSRERRAPGPPLARVDGREAPPRGRARRGGGAARRRAGAARVPARGGHLRGAARAVAIADALGATVDAGPAPLAYQAARGQHGHARRDPRPGRAARGLARGPGHDAPAPARAARARTSARSSSWTIAAAPTAAEADEYLELPAERAVEALWLLRALVREVRAAGDGLPSEALAGLAGRLRGCRHAAILHGDGARPPTATSRRLGARRAGARPLPRHAHVVSLPLRRDATRAGAEDVLAWQTGYAARGRPRLRPSARGDVRTRPAPTRRLGASGGRPRPCRRCPPSAIASAAARAAARVAIAPAAGGTGRRPCTASTACPVPLRAPVPAERPGDDEVLDGARGSGWPDAADRRRPRVRPGQRGGRRGPRRLPRRTARSSPSCPPTRRADRRARHGRDAGRRRHPRPHRRAEGQRRAQPARPRSTAPTRSTAPRCCARAPAAPSRPRSPPATATRCSATRPSSRPPRRRSPRATCSPSCATRR